jgi:hypothetical protein
LWHAPRDLAAAPSSNPVIDVTADRTAIVAWRASELDSEGNGIQSGLLDARSRAPDGTLSASQRLSTTPTRNYRLAVAPSGEALLGWVPSAPDTADLRYATRPPGGPFGAAQVVAGVAPAGDYHGGPAALGDGTFLETYTSAERVRVIARPRRSIRPPNSTRAASTRSSPRRDGVPSRPGSSPRATRCGSSHRHAPRERRRRAP